MITHAGAEGHKKGTHGEVEPRRIWCGGRETQATTKKAQRSVVV